MQRNRRPLTTFPKFSESFPRSRLKFPEPTLEFPEVGFSFPIFLYEILKFKDNFLHGVFHANVVCLNSTSTIIILIYIFNPNPYPNLHLTRACAKLNVWLMIGYGGCCFRFKLGFIFGYVLVSVWFFVRID